MLTYCDTYTDVCVYYSEPELVQRLPVWLTVGDNFGNTKGSALLLKGLCC
jgi:hypothetical protein